MRGRTALQRAVLHLGRPLKSPVAPQLPVIAHALQTAWSQQALSTASTAPELKPLQIEKLLIANRGEIACRIIGTARRLGIRTVAVYSEADKHAVHVRQADEAVCVGPAAALKSYLNQDAIMQAIKQTGAQAVHPGYGFLSENAGFVERLEEEGVIFVGPSAKAIHALGDKIESKRIGKEAGMSIIPGYVGEVMDDAQAREVAHEIGYPIMVKASAGGGGKGMRVVWNEDQLLDELHLAKAESFSAFGDARLLMEKYIQSARHIEFQVVGDAFGNLVHLPERDCSVQRRNQKVIEETPSPAVTPEVRAAMGAQAVALAKAVGYKSTGTVEFVMDHNNNFYFLEMNTRLQVEHPVSEAVSGLDLVELMIRVAENKPLGITQEQAGRINGWAMETRVYAENPLRGFIPSPGQLSVYREPVGANVRVDTGVTEGSTIPVHYDPMIAKLVTHGRNRKEALAGMAAALDSYVVRGLVCNLPILRSMLNVPDFAEGQYDTSFIPKHYGDPAALNPLAFPLSERQTQELLAAAAFIHAREQLRLNLSWLGSSGHAELALTVRDVVAEAAAAKQGKQQQQQQPQQALPQPLKAAVRRAPAAMVGAEGVAAQALEVEVPGRVVCIREVAEKEGGAAGRARYCSVLHHLDIDGQQVYVQVLGRQPRGFTLQYAGAQRELLIEHPDAAALHPHMPTGAASASAQIVLSPMTGTLVEVLVKAGDKVEIGDDLVVLEAMKMRNAIRAERAGVVGEVLVQQGDVVMVDKPLIRWA